jgi:hypothetical protein
LSILTVVVPRLYEEKREQVRIKKRIDKERDQRILIRGWRDMRNEEGRKRRKRIARGRHNKTTDILRRKQRR